MIESTITGPGKYDAVIQASPSMGALARVLSFQSHANLPTAETPEDILS